MRVLSLGVAAVDLLAFVARFPLPDDKVRTTDFKVTGGGNAGNTATGLSRLGVPVALITKVGADKYGEDTIAELKGDGVDTSQIIVKDSMNTAFTYVIVDEQDGTRTCIHTPALEEVLESDIVPEMLDGVDLLHLDSRHTKAAVKLAALANERGISIVLDAEKDRPHFSPLFPLCDYIITNSQFPMTYTGKSNLLEGMASLLKIGRAKLVVSTQGEKGSVLMVKGEGEEEKQETFEGVLQAENDVYVCPESKERHRVVRCGAWPLGGAKIVDTTGAGDAFIAGFTFGLLHKYPLAKSLGLASFVACRKLTAAGARAGLPHRDQVDPRLLP